MRRLRRGLAWLAAFTAAMLLVLAAGAVISNRPGMPELFPARDGQGVDVYLVSHGFHSGLMLPRAALASVAGEAGQGALVAIAARFAAYEAIEVGWGEEAFYRQTPTLAAFDWRLALRALFGRPLFDADIQAVVHVVGVSGPAGAAFPAADIVRLPLSPQGFARLVARLEASLAATQAHQPIALGPGLYGPSLFYRAVGSFSFANVCNHWTARLLSEAGVPTSLVAATLPAGLILDLRLRSGLSPLPRA